MARKYVEADDPFAAPRLCGSCGAEDVEVELVKTPSPYGYTCSWAHPYDCGNPAARALHDLRRRAA